MQRRGILHHPHVLALDSAESEFGNRGGRVLKQPAFVGGVAPCARDDLGAVKRPDVVLVSLDDPIDGVAGQQAFFHQQRFDRFRAQRGRAIMDADDDGRRRNRDRSSALPLSRFRGRGVLFQIALPKVDQDALVGFRGAAPKLPRGNAHAVKMLRVFARP